MVVTGTSVSSSEKALRFCKSHGFHCTAGVHPHDAKTCNELTMSHLERLAANAEAFPHNFFDCCFFSLKI